MSTRRRAQLAILLAAVMWSTAGIGQRELSVSAATQVAGRALFAALTLAIVTLALERRRTLGLVGAMGRWGLAFAVLMAISSGTFMLALSYTTVANVLFMQAAAPLLAALLGWALLGDAIGARTALAIAVSALGVAVMVAGSFESGWVATALPFVMTAAFAGVVVIARHRSEVSMLPATCLSQVMVVVVVAPFASFSAATEHDWAVMAALGIGQMGLALALLTIGARLIAPAEVALLTLVEVVLGPLWVWLAYGERPAATTVAGGLIVLLAVAIQATAPQPSPSVQAFG